MKTIKYRFDSETLEYVEVGSSSKRRVLAMAIYCAAALILGHVAFFRGWADPIIHAALSRQNESYLIQIDQLGHAVVQLHNQLASLHTREQQLYRSLLNMQPLDAGVWEAGFGGGQTYTNLEPAQLRQLAEEIHSLRYKADLQQFAYAESYSEAQRMQLRTESYPVVIPTHGINVSGFGHRCTSSHGSHFHTGVDLAARHGDPVYAAGAGVIRVVGWLESGYGLQIQIDHQNGYITRYAHLSASIVKPGQRVVRGEEIARIGSTGLSTGPHLHYEIIHNGQALNPSPFMQLNSNRKS